MLSVRSKVVLTKELNKPPGSIVESGGLLFEAKVTGAWLAISWAIFKSSPEDKSASHLRNYFFL